MQIKMQSDQNGNWTIHGHISYCFHPGSITNEQTREIFIGGEIQVGGRQREDDQLYQE